MSRRLLAAIGIPLGLLLAVFAILWGQVARMRDVAHWVDHTDQVIAGIYEVQRDMALQESAVRGFLLSGDRSLLDEHEYARTHASFEDLAHLVRNDRVQLGRLHDGLHRYEGWTSSIAPLLDPSTDPTGFRAGASLEKRRSILDGAQGAMAEMLRGEIALRRGRVESAAAATESAMRWAALLFVALAAAIALVTRNQLLALSNTYTASLASERDLRRASEDQNWIRAQHMQLSKNLQGELSLGQLGARVLEQITLSTEAVVAALYVAEPTGFRRVAAHGVAAGAPEFFASGTGLIGRAASERAVVCVAGAPGQALRVQSGVADHPSTEVMLVPGVVEATTTAVMEVGFFKLPSERARELLGRIGETLGSAVRSVQYRMRLRELLEESRRQTEELQTQQEELRVTNEELQAQSDALRAAHVQLEQRKQELEGTNARLVEQRDALERVQTQLADKANELERASRYKSEFLANMSHELRTPLNSTLILAKLLADNKQENLSDEQVHFANTIYESGNDLLALINDILDLSKIEAGRVDVNPVETELAALIDPVVSLFSPVARDKGLQFDVSVQGDVAVRTDPGRVQQILKNLLSNAFKFTQQGQVGLQARCHAQALELVVSDTGIGIPKQQHQAIFEAFRQADGTTNRKFGGTGLGLSISRDLAALLGGTLELESEPGKGSSFTLRLPRESPAPRAPAASPPPAIASSMRAERERSRPHAATRPKPDPSRRNLLIIEDDPAFAEVLENLARELHYEPVTAQTADEGVRLALELIPSAVVLDMQLPDHSGLSVLDRLKRDPSTRHVPVHVISVADHAQTALSMGAAGYLLKPVKYEQLTQALTALADRFTRVRRLLVVEDDPVQREAIIRLLSGQAIELVAVANVNDALAQLSSFTFDCIVTDLTLPDASGYDLLERLAGDERYAFPPVIVYTARSLSPEEEQRLRRYSSSIIIKGARSPERLLDEVTLFLHQVESELPPDRQRMLRQARDREAVFAGRKILLAEDDVRNIFALGQVLEPKGAELVIARNGREAVEQVKDRSDIDLVLMDIMMPEMDGLAAMRAIRQLGGRHAKLPIIALTAKAMPDDQERCLRAGANDYVAKPLDIDLLLSLIRVWMPK